MFRCLGILREVLHSPNRETDDALILKTVLAQLENLGVKSRLISPDELDGYPTASHHLILPMCESYARLMRLMPLTEDSDALWINSPNSVLLCYRVRMIPRLKDCPEIHFPPSEIRLVKDGAGKPPEFHAPEGWWIKRGDVHNTCDRDVLRAPSWREVSAILGDFARREITHWVAQPHIPGDLVKFYGVGPGRWFTWFYHDPMRARRFPFILDRLATQAACGANALGLEVFGGDAIISPRGGITLIDLNSWPSFALVRSEAAVQIAWHLQNRLLSMPSRNKARAGGRASTERRS